MLVFCYSKEHDHSDFYQFLQMESNNKFNDCYFFYYSTCIKVRWLFQWTWKLHYCQLPRVCDKRQTFVQHTHFLSLFTRRLEQPCWSWYWRFISLVHLIIRPKDTFSSLNFIIFVIAQFNCLSLSVDAIWNGTSSIIFKPILESIIL